MDSMTLNDDGTVDIALDDDTAVHLPRPKIRQFRDLSEVMERADAEFRELSRGDWPEDLKDQAAALALGDLGSPTGSAAQRAKHKSDMTERTVGYGEQLFLNRLLQGPGNPYPKVWVQVLKVLGGMERVEDDLPAWMSNYLSLASLQQHWISVPLRLGPTTGQPAADSQTTPTT